MRAFLNKIFCFRAFSSFKYSMHGSEGHYRVTGFYWVYTTSDGHRIYIHVPKRLANHVGGYGVCGVIVPFDKITLTKIKLRKRWFFRKNDKHILKLIEEDREKYKMYKKFPKGLSGKEIEEIVINKIVEEMCGKEDTSETKSHIVRIR